MSFINSITNGVGEDTIPLGLYLWTRLKQIGVSTIFGVPGDFNLELLDYIYNTPGLDFIGSSNELNAAYCADGYARVKIDDGIPGVFVTTHGVGEMSAINGVLGSLCERTRVVHVVGQTSRKLQEGRLMIHHSIGNDTGSEDEKPDHQMYNKMSKAARVAEAELWDAATAPAEIDRVIRECVIQAAPVYIFVPLDLCMDHVPKSLLATPIDLSLPRDVSAEASALDSIAEAITQAERPCLFVDGLVSRYSARKECKELARFLRIPVYTCNMGKSTIDESEEYFAGMYQGKISDEHIIQAFEESDCVLVLGSCDADTNSGGFTRNIDTRSSIWINPTSVVVQGKRFERTYIKSILAQLPTTLSNIKISRIAVPTATAPKLDDDLLEEQLTHSWLWDKLAAFVQPNDVIVGETGTTSFGIFFSTLPANVTVVGQTYYGSIGYATPATLGAEVALQELEKEKGQPRGRTILITGDGSLQLTMQEIGTMITAGVKPIIIILNNNGYTIERVIHGARQKYNDINVANYKYMLPFFGHPDPENCYRKVVTREDFGKVFQEKDVREPKNLMVLELMLDAFDAPVRLTKQISMRGPTYKEYLEREGFLGKDRIGASG